MLQIAHLTNHEANCPITECFQCVCHDTQPWLISFSLGEERLGGLGSLLSASRDPGLISVEGAIPFAQLKQAYLDGKLGELCDRSSVSWINWHDAKVSSMAHSWTRIGRAATILN